MIQRTPADSVSGVRQGRIKDDDDDDDVAIANRRNVRTRAPPISASRAACVNACRVYAYNTCAALAVPLHVGAGVGARVGRRGRSSKHNKHEMK